MREMKDSGVEWIGKIPADWDMVNLSSIFGERKRKNVGLEERNLLSLSYGSVIKKDIDTSDGLLPVSFEGYNIIESGDIVLRLTDLQNDRRSLRTGLCKERGIITSAYCTLMKKMPEINSAYMQYYLHSFDICKGFYGMGAGVRQGLNFDGIRKLVMLFPNAETQAQICAYLDAQTARIDEALYLNRAQIEELRLYKQSLITETVTRGLDPDAPMKDSGVDWIGAMPESWSVQRVRDIGWTQNGISKKGDFFGSGFPFVSYGDVYRNYELPFSVSGQIESDAKERESYSVQAGDIFFTRTSETIDEVGFSCVCKKTIPEAVFAGFLIRLRPYKAESVILSDYAKYYFRSGHIRQYLTKEMNLVTRASLAQGLLKAMNVLIPPKKEQEAIAAFLDNKTAKIDALISLKQSKIEKLTRYRQSLIYEYVTGKKEAP